MTNSQSKSNSSFVLGLVLGAVIGAAIAIFYYKKNKSDVFAQLQTNLEKYFKKIVNQFIPQNHPISATKKPKITQIEVKKSRPKTFLKSKK